MKLSLAEILKLQNADRANQELHTWICGAEAVALLVGSVESGIIDALQTTNSVERIADITALEKKRVLDILNALEAHGLVKQVDRGFRMSPRLEILTSKDATRPLIDILNATKVRIRELEGFKHADNIYTKLSTDDILSMAQGIVISALSFARNFMGVGLGETMPELKRLWQTGAHHLEAGCGVGNTLFQIVATYPKVTALGVEIELDTANEALRRADILGLSERVEIRQMDACGLKEKAVFDTAQWSQFFFPTEYRADLLKMLYRAIKPGGYVFMPLLPSSSINAWEYRGHMLGMALKSLTAEPFLSLVFLKAFLLTLPHHQILEKRLASINRLVYRIWGVPIKTTIELQEEIEESGFRLLRVISTPASQFFPNRGLMLAQRP